jgi:hypothetical protein
LDHDTVAIAVLLMPNPFRRTEPKYVTTEHAGSP